MKSADAASRGLVALNTQFIDLMRSQSDATLGLWRATISAPSLSEAVKAQSSGMRKAYESTAMQLKTIARDRYARCDRDERAAHGPVLPQGLSVPAMDTAERNAFGGLRNPSECGIYSPARETGRHVLSCSCSSVG